MVPFAFTQYNRQCGVSHPSHPCPPFIPNQTQQTMTTNSNTNPSQDGTYNLICTGVDRKTFQVPSLLPQSITAMTLKLPNQLLASLSSNTTSNSHKPQISIRFGANKQFIVDNQPFELTCHEFAQPLPKVFQYTAPSPSVSQRSDIRGFYVQRGTCSQKLLVKTNLQVVSGKMKKRVTDSLKESQNRKSAPLSSIKSFKSGPPITPLKALQTVPNAYPTRNRTRTRIRTRTRSVNSNTDIGNGIGNGIGKNIGNIGNMGNGGNLSLQQQLVYLLAIDSFTLKEVEKRLFSHPKKRIMGELSRIAVCSSGSSSNSQGVYFLRKEYEQGVVLGLGVKECKDWPYSKEELDIARRRVSGNKKEKASVHRDSGNGTVEESTSRNTRQTRRASKSKTIKRKSETETETEISKQVSEIATNATKKRKRVEPKPQPQVEEPVDCRTEFDSLYPEYLSLSRELENHQLLWKEYEQRIKSASTDKEKGVIRSEYRNSEGSIRESMERYNVLHERLSLLKKAVKESTR